MNNRLQSMYLSSESVRQRNSIGLNAWAGSFAVAPLPDPLTDDWIRQRVTAEQTPMMLETKTIQTLGYFQQDTKTQEDIYDLISPIRPDDRETELATRIVQVVGGFISRYAAQSVSAQQVTDWKAANGITE